MQVCWNDWTIFSVWDCVEGLGVVDSTVVKSYQLNIFFIITYLLSQYKNQNRTHVSNGVEYFPVAILWNACTNQKLLVIGISKSCVNNLQEFCQETIFSAQDLCGFRKNTKFRADSIEFSSYGTSCA